MIKVKQTIQAYEVNGEEVGVGKLGDIIIKVNSHWNRDYFVVLAIEGKEYTVSASDLTAAIKNAQNTSKYL